MNCNVICWVLFFVSLRVAEGTVNLPLSDTCQIQNVASSGTNHERTFIMIKPDGVQRGLIGKIISRFEQKGFKLVAMKFMKVSGFFCFKFQM